MPQITFDVTDAQLLQLDNLNAARNAKLAEGAEPHSRETFAAQAFTPALEAALVAEPPAVAGPKGKGKGKGK
jgi:hypothetical protein